MRFADYAKLERIKSLILGHLYAMGLKKQVKALKESDLDQIIILMNNLGDQLKLKDTDEERLEMLVSYIIGLWAKLIIEYGADINEL